LSKTSRSKIFGIAVKTPSSTTLGAVVSDVRLVTAKPEKATAVLPNAEESLSLVEYNDGQIYR